MTSDEQKTEEQELKEMEAQLMADKEAQEAAARVPEPVEPPSPPVPESPAPTEPPASEEVAVTQPQASKPEDDPMEWAKRKGFKSPEDMARALLKKEQEFHESRQRKEREMPLPPPMPAWNPTPQMPPVWGYPPPMSAPSRTDITKQLAQESGLDPESVDAVMPLIVKVASAVSARERAAMEQRLANFERSTQSNNELMSLMQDPAFSDLRVQQEMHRIIDANPSIQERSGHRTMVFNQAVMNLYRKQLQQGVTNGANPINTPPVTAGGGNGSFTAQRPVTEREFDTWSLKEQEAFVMSNGKIRPKR